MMKDVMNTKPRIFCGYESDWREIPPRVVSCRKAKHITRETRIRRGITEVICETCGITYYRWNL